MSYSSIWSDLNLYPAKRNTLECSIIVGIDQKNYIALQMQQSHKKTVKFINIYKYCIKKDQWNIICKINTFWVYGFISATLDTKKQTLFLFGIDYVKAIQLKNKSINNYSHPIIIPHIPEGSKCIITNKNLFLIGGWNNNSILKWNEQTKIFTKFCYMYNKMMIACYGLIYTNNCLLLFGGYDCNNHVCIDYILEFNIKNKQWNKLSVALPQKISEIGCTIGINDQYIFLIGGHNGNISDCYYDTIYIYSIQHHIIQKSKIKCPSPGIFQCITVNNKSQDEIIVCGYINQICTLLCPNLYLPHDIQKIINSYYLNESIHLLDTSNLKHYKINSLDII